MPSRRAVDAGLGPGRLARGHQRPHRGGGVGVAGLGLEGDPGDAVRVQAGQLFGRLLEGERPRIDALAGEPDHVRVEGVGGFGRHEEEPAGLRESLDSELVVERLEELEALLDEADRHLVRVVLSDEGGRVAGRPRGEAALFEQDDVRHAQLRQEVEDAGAQRPAADDYGLSGPTHPADALSPASGRCRSRTSSGISMLQICTHGRGRHDDSMKTG